MKTKLLIKEIEKIINHLQKLDRKLPVRVNLAIVRNLKELRTEYENAENTRIKILEAYAQKDMNGNAIIKDGNYSFDNEENARKVVKQIDELNNTEAEIEICTIDIRDIEQSSDYDVLTTCDIEALEFMIKQE